MTLRVKQSSHRINNCAYTEVQLMAIHFDHRFNLRKTGKITQSAVKQCDLSNDQHCSGWPRSHSISTARDSRVKREREESDTLHTFWRFTGVPLVLATRWTYPEWNEYHSVQQMTFFLHTNCKFRDYRDAFRWVHWTATTNGTLAVWSYLDDVLL